MGGIPLGRVSQIVQVTTALEACGTSPERLMGRLGMPMWHHCPPDGFAPYEHLYRLVDEGGRTLGLPTFGARVMEVVPVQQMGQLGVEIFECPNVYQALQTAASFLERFGTTKRWWLEERQEEVWFCRGGDGMWDMGEPGMIQYALTGAIQIVRAAVPGWRPAKVWIQTEVVPELARSDLFSHAEIRTHRSFSAIAIPRSVLSWPIPQRCGATAAGAIGSAARDSPPGDLAGSVRGLVGTLLSEGYPTIETMAGVAGLQVRTLQRRLKTQGTTYKDLVEQARFDSATRLLRGSDAKVTEIALELGYLDTAHFTRAFRRWAGVSPRAYRRSEAARLGT